MTLVATLVIYFFNLFFCFRLWIRPVTLCFHLSCVSWQWGACFCISLLFTEQPESVLFCYPQTFSVGCSVFLSNHLQVGMYMMPRVLKSVQSVFQTFVKTYLKKTVIIFLRHFKKQCNLKSKCPILSSVCLRRHLQPLAGTSIQTGCGICTPSGRRSRDTWISWPASTTEYWGSPHSSTTRIMKSMLWS